MDDEKNSFTTLTKEDIVNCRKNGKKRALIKIAEVLEKLTMGKPEAKEIAATTEVIPDNETNVTKKSESLK